MLHVKDITWPELSALDRAQTVVFIPFSPLEEHGPHLPIGTDLYMAQHFATAIAAKLEAARPTVSTLLVPPIPLGAGTISMQGSVNVSVDLIYDVARQIASAYARDGFRYIVFTNGHMGIPHLFALENAARVVSRRFGVHCIAPSASILRQLIQRRGMASKLPTQIDEADRADFFAANHSGMLETSVMLALHPTMVKSSFVHLPRLTRSIKMLIHRRQSTSWAGYMGDPAKASAALGDIAIDELATAGAAIIGGIMDTGKRPAVSTEITPRVPFWLSVHRVRPLLVAFAVGAALAVLTPRIIAQEK